MRKHLTYANVMATVAIVLAVGGGAAYAANTVFSSDIVDGEVRSVDLANNSVRTAKIADGQVTAGDLAPPEAWHAVRAGSSSSDRCATGAVAVFCSYDFVGDFFPWKNYGSGFATAAYYKDQLGIVHLKGLVANDVEFSGQTVQSVRIFRMPGAYRPDSRRTFASVGSATADWSVGPGRVDVGPDGLVSLVSDCAPAADLCSSTGAYVTLDGIGFRPDE